MNNQNFEYCVKCGIENTEIGVIYIRYEINGKWGSHPCCTKCWYKDNPDRIPMRINNSTEK